MIGMYISGYFLMLPGIDPCCKLCVLNIKLGLYLFFFLSEPHSHSYGALPAIRDHTPYYPPHKPGERAVPYTQVNTSDRCLIYLHCKDERLS